jgi:hypothetical protein
LEYGRATNVCHSGEKSLIFDGKTLHKQAFSTTVKQNHAGAALLAGVLEDKLATHDANYITQRMEKVKKAFQGRVSHAIKSSWVEAARKMGMTRQGSGAPVQSWEDLLQEMESNSCMDSFLNWYKICYSDNDPSGNNKRKECESALMRGLKIKYQDNATSGGCLGSLFQSETSNLLETIAKRSRSKQSLHIVKSRPTKGEEELEEGQTPQKGKRVVGDFYVVRSNPSNGKAISFRRFNVSKCFVETLPAIMPTGGGKGVLPLLHLLLYIVSI